MIEEIKEHFEIKIKCKKCGSDNCELQFSDRYGDNELYLGQDIYIKCHNCKAFYIS